MKAAATTGVFTSSNHRIGVGTNAPSNTLDISGTAGNVMVTGDGAHLYMTRPGNNYIKAQSAGGALSFGVNGNADLLPALFLSSSGKTGINTAGPVATLDVAGTVSASDAIQVGSSSLTCAASIAGAIRYNSTSNTIQVCASNVWTSLSSSTTAGGGGTPAGSTGDIQFNNGGGFAADTGQLFWDGTNNRLGVGTSSPGYPLTVSADIALSQTGGTHSPQLTWLVNGTRQGYMGWGTVGSDFDIFADNGNNLALITTGSNAPIVFYPSSTERMRITPAGNVGIGITSPSDPLQVNGNVSSGANGGANGQLVVRRNTDGNATGFISTDTSSNLNITQNGGSGAMIFSTALTERARITNTGNVGIGTTAPGGALEVSGSNALRLSGTTTTHAPYIEWYAGGTRNAYMGWGTPGSSFNLSMENGNALNIIASSTTFSGIIAPGNMSNFYIGSSGGNPVVNWDANDYLIYDRSANSLAMNIGSTPYMTVTTSGVTSNAYLYSSDRRLKSDITSLTGGLAKLDALNPASFRFTADPSKTVHLGLIAQDVQKVYPEAVKVDDKGYLKLDYPSLIGPIVGMLKELKDVVLTDHEALADAQREIGLLRAANDNLKAANDNLSRPLDVLERSSAH